MTPARATLHDPVALSAQADVLLTLAAALGEPDPARAARVVEAGEAAPALADRAELGSAVAGALEALGCAAALVPLDAWREEHQRLFSGAVVCPPNEAGFVRRDKGAILGDIGAFHAAFGIALAPEAAERADHVVAELELLALLLVMVARAEAEERDADAEVARGAVTALVCDHLADWLPAFALRLAATTSLVLYRAAAEALAHVWDGLCDAHGLEDEAPGRPLPVVRPEAGTPYECGAVESEQGGVA